jgi:hypothetical protein
VFGSFAKGANGMSQANGFGRRGGRTNRSEKPADKRSPAEDVSEADEARAAVPNISFNTKVYISAAAALFAAVFIGLPMMAAMPGGLPLPSLPKSNVDLASVVQQQQRQQGGVPLSGAGAGSDQRQQAAMKYFGFYHLNTVARAGYCGELGVDMSVFSAKFRASQAALIDRANSILGAQGISEDQVLEESRPQLDAAIQEEQQAFSDKMKMSPQLGCQMMQQMADQIIPSLDFAKIMPEEHKILMSR